MSTRPPTGSTSAIRVTVIGPCASGKTTLVEHLQALGFDAWATAQEHSGVPDLWNHQHPDALIGLRTDLETIRQRRGESWPQSIYDAQMARLQTAYQSAGLIVDTSISSEEESLRAALAYLKEVGSTPR